MKYVCATVLAALLLALVFSTPAAYAHDDSRFTPARREQAPTQRLRDWPVQVQPPQDEDATQALMRLWLRRGTLLFVGWLAVLAALFLIGVLLSRVTLAALSGPRGGGRRDIAGGIVRSLYRAVVIIASLYFYLSLPLLVPIAAAATATFFYLFLVVIGRIPVQLMLIICAYTVYAAYTVVRGILGRPAADAIGRSLSRVEAPGLWALAEEVARRVCARPIDAIAITPGTEVAVVEGGSLWQRLRGAGRRRLILGLGALSHMPQNQLKAILAHEYGHFSRHDGAGGNVALHVRRSIYRMAQHLAAGGQTHSLNPIWLFLNGFNQVYLRITLGASRLQEILADRDAARVYGVQSVADALTYIVHQRLVFDLQVSREVELSRGLRRALQNLYTLPDTPPASLQERLERQLEQQISRPSSPYDSHPAVRERLDRLRRLAPADPPPESREPALDLLPTAETLQNEMTALLQDNLRLRHTLI